MDRCSLGKAEAALGQKPVRVPESSLHGSRDSVALVNWPSRLPYRITNRNRNYRFGSFFGGGNFSDSGSGFTC